MHSLARQGKRRWGGGCEFISAPIAATDESGGDFSSVHVRWWYIEEEEEVENAHS